MSTLRRMSAAIRSGEGYVLVFLFATQYSHLQTATFKSCFHRYGTDLLFQRPETAFGQPPSSQQHSLAPVQGTCKVQSATALPFSFAVEMQTGTNCRFPPESHAKTSDAEPQRLERGSLLRPGQYPGGVSGTVTCLCLQTLV